MSAQHLPGLADLCRGVASLAHAAGREDLAARLGATVAKVTRPATVICVVGEFKQGKSSLVNALLGSALCPVDDDLATSAITLLRFGPEFVVTVRRRTGEQITAEIVDPASLPDWVTESGNPDNHKGVERVDVIVPSPLLSNGLVVVDTPGMGGLGAGHAAATMAFLPFADGLVLVSDVSSELSQPELEFLRKARDLCPNVLLAQTKTDLYPEWRRIVDLNQGHLAEADIALDTVALSAVLREEASAKSDVRLDQRSGYPELIALLVSKVIEPAKRLAVERARIEIGETLTQLEAPLQEEATVLSDPGRADKIIEGLNQAKNRLEHLRGPGARWSLILSDRTIDLTNDVTHRLRGAVRNLQREMDEAIETLKTPEDWDGVATQLQTAIAGVVTQSFVEIEDGGRRVQEEIVELLAADSLQLTPLGTSGQLDVAELWRGKSLGAGGSKGGAALGTALTGLRGAQSGMIMLGMAGQFLPRGATLLLMSNPVTLGLGAAFAGMQLFEAHKRKIQMRRQQARSQVRQFLDDVQFEGGHRVNDALRELQRTLRDEFTEQIGELQRTYADTAQKAQEAAQASQESAAVRSKEVNARLLELSTWRDRLAGVVPTA